MTASINDVAQAAGVSASTVSRALRGRQGVSDEVRDRIAAVAAQLGYTASRSASSLASGRTCTIGVLVPYVGRWFFGTVLDAAEKVFSAAGYDVLLYNLGSPETRKRFFTRLPVRKRVDAVLSLLIPDDEESAALRSLGVPLATTVGGTRPGFTVVGIDDRAGTESAVRHLVNLGHRRIGMISGSSGPL
ncbi:LacI family DNA-binding transcriptional regulator, partial [Streptomyces hirsutus]|uniref:LacI family DNA-binding transcriptional regulator n=1 Tax=Streptomyces hirsutus TaxID=35620 RepID=UPI001F0A67F9